MFIKYTIDCTDDIVQQRLAEKELEHQEKMRQWELNKNEKITREYIEKYGLPPGVELPKEESE
jgi:uncharacterized membrane protein